MSFYYQHLYRIFWRLFLNFEKAVKHFDFFPFLSRYRLTKLPECYLRILKEKNYLFLPPLLFPHVYLWYTNTLYDRRSIIRLEFPCLDIQLCRGGGGSVVAQAAIVTDADCLCSCEPPWHIKRHSVLHFTNNLAPPPSQPRSGIITHTDSTSLLEARRTLE